MRRGHPRSDATPAAQEPLARQFLEGAPGGRARDVEALTASIDWVVEALGWTNFFWLCFALAVPGMLLLFKVAPWHGDRSPRTEAATA